MGSYDAIFHFNIESKRHLLDILVEPSFDRAACFQFHQMNDDSYMLHWNYEVESKRLIPRVKEFALHENLSNCTLFDVLDHPDFKGFLKDLCPISKALLNEKQKAAVNLVLDTDLPTEVKKSYGLDGHNYTFTIFGETDRSYSCWCTIPQEWALLSELIDIVSKVTNLQHSNYRLFYLLRK